MYDGSWRQVVGSLRHRYRRADDVYCQLRASALQVRDRLIFMMIIVAVIHVIAVYVY